MDLMKEVPYLDLCKDLQNLGFPQNKKGWYWAKWKKDEIFDLVFTFNDNNVYSMNGKLITYPKYTIKAPTVNEMLEFIPNEINIVDNNYWFKMSKRSYGYSLSYEEIYHIQTFSVVDENLANAFAKLLIKMNHYKYIDFKETKEDMNDNTKN